MTPSAFMDGRLAEYRHQRGAGNKPGQLLDYLGMTAREFVGWQATGQVPPRVVRNWQPRIDAISRAEDRRLARIAESERCESWCLAHRRPVRWQPAPAWWYHHPADVPELSQCPGMLAAHAPAIP